MDYTGMIENIASLHNIPNMDKEYVLYYDETNNARVFKLTEEGFNFDEHAYFILGGLAFEKGKINSCCTGSGSGSEKFWGDYKKCRVLWS